MVKGKLGVEYVNVLVLDTKGHNLFFDGELHFLVTAYINTLDAVLLGVEDIIVQEEVRRNGRRFERGPFLFLLILEPVDSVSPLVEANLHVALWKLLHQ